MVGDNFYVKKWVERARAEECDLFISCLGYESRASFITVSRSIPALKNVAIGFDYSKVLSYEKNRGLYLKKGFIVEECGDTEFEDVLERMIPVAASLSIVVDVSSFSRYRIATIVSVLRKRGRNCIIEATFLYAVAQYSRPPRKLEPVLETAPIRFDFAGWPSDPGEPLACVVGVGYEEGKAIGAIEFLEAGHVWLFRPTGWDDRFERAVDRQNRDLFMQVPPSNIVAYQLEFPYALYIRMSSLVRGLSNEGRVALLPFGPKMFSVVALIVAMCNEPQVSVWRVTSKQFEKPVNRKAAGQVCGIRLIIGDAPERGQGERELAVEYSV